MKLWNQFSCTTFCDFELVCFECYECIFTKWSISLRTWSILLVYLYLIFFYSNPRIILKISYINYTEGPSSQHFTTQKALVNTLHNPKMYKSYQELFTLHKYLCKLLPKCKSR
jgi:hypothetical protein